MKNPAALLAVLLLCGGARAQGVSGGSGMTVIDGYLGAAWTGTGFGEDYQLGLPSGWQARAPAPLLVAWHGFGAPPEEIFRETGYPRECERRGWFLLAPRGLDDKSFGWPPAQRNVARLLEYITASYPIDPERIYGVGWSMGAQAILSFAARQRDARHPALAAVAAIAGPHDLVDTYRHETAIVRAWMELLLEGPPLARPAAWRAISNLAITPGTHHPQVGAHMAMNLDRVPTLIAYALDDTIAYLPAQNAALAELMRSRGAPVLEWAFRGFRPSHSWNLVAAGAVCSFLAGRRLERWPRGRLELMSDGLAPLYGLELRPDGPGVLARIDLEIDRPAGSVTLGQTRDLAEVVLDVEASGIDPRRDLVVHHASADGSADRVLIHGWRPAPARVLRDGRPFAGWRYDPASGPGFTGGGAHRYQLQRDAFDVDLAVGPPRAGAELVFALAGAPPSSPWMLLLSGRLEEFPLARLAPGDPRWLAISPLGPTVILGGRSNSAGAGRLGLWMPADPALAGELFHAQALLLLTGARAGMSNPVAIGPIR